MAVRLLATFGASLSGESRMDQGTVGLHTG